MKIRLAAPLQSDSILDGEGIRAIVWTQGCIHNCFGCQNPQTHSFTDGYLEDIENLKQDISDLKYHDGITLSGGDPFCQSKECAEIAKYVHELGMNVWCYTGYTYEQIINSKNKNMLNLLENVDVLVDGKFEIDKLSYDLIFRGSSNQRIIDVPNSLKQNKIVIISKYDEKDNDKKNNRTTFV